MSVESAPIVLLHGVGLDRTIWDAVVADLGTTAPGHPVTALDLPGHGRQPRLTEPVELADLAADLLDRMPSEPVHLVGFSVGALIAQYIAVHHPDRVLTLTCVNSVCARTPEEAASVRARLETAGDDFALGAERAVDRWFPEDAGIPGAAVLRDRTRRILLANDIPSYLHVYRVFATGDAELADELHRIRVPVLAVTGSDDPGSTPEMSYRIAERIPGAHVHIIDGARHMVPDTHPELLSALIAELATTIESTGTTGRSQSHDHH
ncbi:alpha/beta fold hydrolase [Corynebacterium terpenotabidum]|uniref:Alpha/beta hydrolase fold protein n=1 Tax=Corynebacterium terpenotabidum Y-11 TaxID=1200352 RepID=S4XJE8_9CORY|nr:alpha/beta hydrolase [Corynebacterium terpenotabidum]AGP31875.1 alpha/beta hydrolase fold protein [Corynebacterium terpenotabidum Y-11]